MEQVKEGGDDEIYSYLFETQDTELLYRKFKAYGFNCDIEKGGVSLVMKRAQMPEIIAEVINDGAQIYAVNQQSRTLEQDFISMTTGTKTQIQ